MSAINDDIKKAEEEAIQILNNISSIPPNPDVNDIISRRDTLAKFFSTYNNILTSPQHASLYNSYEKTKAILNTELSMLSKKGIDKAQAYKEKCKIIDQLENILKIRQRFIKIWLNSSSLSDLRERVKQNGVDSIHAIARKDLKTDDLYVIFVTSEGQKLGTYYIDNNDEAILSDVDIAIDQTDNLTSLKDTELKKRVMLFKLNLSIHEYEPTIPENTESTESNNSESSTESSTKNQQAQSTTDSNPPA